MGSKTGNSVLICDGGPEKSEESSSSDFLSLFGFNLGEFQLNIFPTGDTRFTRLTMGPGLYLIYCKPKALFYIGQSINTISRLGRHYDNLCCGKSDSKAMQNDWDNYGSESFLFISLAVGSEYEYSDTREQIERYLIALNKDQVYNISGNNFPGPTRKVRVLYESQFFDSIASAARATGISKTQIRRLLDDPTNFDWQQVSDDLTDETAILNNEKAKPIEIDGKSYNSIKDAERQIKISRRTILRRLKDNRYTNYKYLQKKEKETDS